MAKIGILILFIFQAWFSLAQEDDFQEQQNLDEIDSLYEADSKSERSRDRDLEKRVEKTNINPRKASDLKLLESFDDIAVIQRRYLPKSGRFEFFVGGGTNINDAFFVGNGLQARFGYHLNERFAIELMGDLFSNSNRNVTEELKEAGIETFGFCHWSRLDRTQCWGFGGGQRCTCGDGKFADSAFEYRSDLCLNKVYGFSLGLSLAYI